MGFHFVEMHIESATGLSHLIQCSIPHREAATRKNECKNDIFQVRAALHQLRNVNCEGCDRHTLTQRKTLSLCYSPFHSFAIFYVGTINGFQYQRFWHSHPISTFRFFLREYCDGISEANRYFPLETCDYTLSFSIKQINHTKAIHLKIFS